ncbi:predicted protein [Histoplasma capsulatum var. duboisii H88]|uniref:Predicted protein n=2 Tax=Ajellomyces capsulatus TaxID=5037 RepID=F0UDX3_AJEC8|nr:predicted protein [Histoplasma capsulatum H143]EGC45334.1 predicted protein [Histoplasma capsulatum var. duboisii H88]
MARFDAELRKSTPNKYLGDDSRFGFDRRFPSRVSEFSVVTKPSMNAEDGPRLWTVLPALQVPVDRPTFSRRMNEFLFFELLRQLQQPSESRRKAAVVRGVSQGTYIAG